MCVCVCFFVSVCVSIYRCFIYFETFLTPHECFFVTHFWAQHVFFLYSHVVGSFVRSCCMFLNAHKWVCEECYNIHKLHVLRHLSFPFSFSSFLLVFYAFSLLLFLLLGGLSWPLNRLLVLIFGQFGLAILIIFLLSS